MLTTEEFKSQIHNWKREGRLDLIRASSRKRIEAKGYIDLGVGSFARWIEPEWLDEAKKRDVVAKDQYGKYVPKVDIETDEEVVGRKGKSVITEVKTRINPRRYNAFMKDYKEFCDKKRGNEYYEKQRLEENKSLVLGFNM